MFTWVAIIYRQSLLTIYKYNTQFWLLSDAQKRGINPKRWPFESNQHHFYHKSGHFVTVNGHPVNVSILSDFPFLAVISILEFAIRLQSEVTLHKTVTLHETLHVISFVSSLYHTDLLLTSSRALSQQTPTHALCFSVGKTLCNLQHSHSNPSPTGKEASS